MVPLILTWLRSFMRPKLLFVLTLAFTVAASGQHFNHPLSGSRGDARRVARALVATDSVRVLAVMVQFQKDNDQSKEGNGQFELTAPSAPLLDAPPRDSAYFAGHLAFAADYFRKVSKGKTTVRWTLLGAVVTLPGVMADYSPGAGESNIRLANLARDAWRNVDSSGRVSDFSRYDCFIVFHAGVGHDVDLVSTLGYDAAPHDIPSLYLGPAALTGLLGGGIPVNGGARVITNTVIMPETENRTLPTATGTVPLTLGINGLLCASLGSYLGLPDLFDTQSGASGIGRFGLMDGQSIFSFSGAFPPAPSAWERYWLGWLTPVAVPAGTTALSLPAAALADTVYRVPISDAEYFLVENRSRDPFRTGQTITSLYGGVTSTRHYARDTAGFTFDDISALTGTITDVDVPDWSLPGGVDVDGTFYDGGVLIWHIDESVINANLGTNGVNADSSHRGVNLEEADGSQDIGHTYDVTSPGSGSESGTALDFWFSGNSSQVNKNEFSSTTFPNSNSNLGALSHVTIHNFSARAPRMTAQVIRGDAVGPIQGYPKQSGESIDWKLVIAPPPLSPAFVVGTTGIPLPRETVSGTLLPTPVSGKLFMFPPDSSGRVTPFRSSGVVALSGGAGSRFTSSSAMADLNGDGFPDIVTVGLDQVYPPSGFIRAYSLRNATADSLATPLFERPFVSQIAPGFFNSPVLGDSLIAVPCSDGSVLLLHFDGSVADSIPQLQGGTFVEAISRWKGPDSFIILYNSGTVTLTVRGSDGSRLRPDVSRVFGAGNNFFTPAVTGLFGPDSVRGKILTAFSTFAGSLYLVDSTLTPVSGFPVSWEGWTGGLVSVILADIDGDGVRDILINAGGKILAFNTSGVLLDNFPIQLPGGASVKDIIAGDVDGDGKVEVVAVSTGGLAYAYNSQGKLAPGFPLDVSGPQLSNFSGVESAALMTVGGKIILVVASGDGSVSAWITGHYTGAPDPRLYPWPQYGRDARHGGVDLTPLAGSLAASAYFPPDRVYNWPNPVYSGKTNFRYFVSQNSSVSIKIFDMAGDLVATLSGQGTGGIDNEIPWDVSHVQSGIYFARIEASSGASSGVKIVKVAVVK